MVFPLTKLLVKVELYLNAAWVDVTAYTYVRDPIQITRGRRDEGGSFEPGDAQLTFNNRDGRFSPRNPVGAYYGQLTRNTPIRISVIDTGFTKRLLLPLAADEATAPDTVGLSITGDIDLRVEADLPSWATTTGVNLLSKALTAGQRSYRLGVYNNGILFIGWSADGTNELFLDCTIPVPMTSGRQAIRATLDVDNGAAGRTATFYTAPTMAGPFVQLGAAVTSAGVTSIFDSTSALSVRASGTSGGGGAKFYAAQVYQGIAGTVRANPDFTAQSEGAASFADAAGNTWTLSSGAALTARRYRYYGEVPSWPQKWDISERDVWVPIAASGVLRRMGQGSAPLQGPIQRYTLTSDATNLRGYWPCEDGSDSTSIGSGLTAGPAMVIAGTPRLATSEIFPAAGALPEMGLASFSGSVNSYTATTIVNARLLMYVPAAGDTASAIVMRVFGSGTAAYWDVTYGTGGSLALAAYDSLGVQLFTTGAVAFAVNGKQLVVVVELVQNGANIDWNLTTVSLISGVGVSWTGTLNTRTVGAATYVQVNPNRLLDTTVIGHLTVRSAGASSINLPLGGYIGETAGSRILRLCGEEGVSFTGGGGDSVAMGTQKPGQLLDLLAECEASDLGQLFESREQFGLSYRTRNSRTIQSADLALAYNALRELNPVEDDQNTRNDVTVSRIAGSSARATVTTGPLSTQAPPNGVGLYDDEVEISLGADTQCADQANLRAVIGTVDEPRYPVIGVQLGGTAFAASQALLLAALDVDHGDRITVTGTPIWVPRGTIDQHTIGQSETLGVREYEIDFVCQPATPIGAADLWDSTTFRWAADGSTVSAGFTSTATGAAAFALVTPTGQPLWTSAAGDFPLDILIAGEQITLSAIAATVSPQSATVSARSVNGVVKAHLAGEAVQIADPTYYQL